MENKESRNEHIHSFALRTLRAQDWDQNNRSTEHEKIRKEANLYGIAPNEILTYTQNHIEPLKDELKKITRA